MSEKTINYGAHLNLAQKELRNVVLQPLATDPTSGRVGQMYFNTATNKQRFCVAVAEDGTPTWQEVGGGGVADLMFSVTYYKLKQMRDGGELIPGAQYRITDYTCTTTKAETQSAGHYFQIIVTADNESTLNETARADNYDVIDPYFDDNNLAAWELKYCLDNDTTRFSWADTKNGRGVVYWMKDEWGNEAYFDFKNIVFKGSLIHKGTEKFEIDPNEYYCAFPLLNEPYNDRSLRGNVKNCKLGKTQSLDPIFIFGDATYNIEIDDDCSNITVGPGANDIKIGKYNELIFVAQNVYGILIGNDISGLDVTESNQTFLPGQTFAGTADEPAEATENNGLVTKSQLDKAIAAIPGLSYKVVSSLPTSDISKSIIYLVQKATAGTQNAYEEYLNTTGTTAGWEKIGDTEIDLSEYVTATALADALALKQNSKYVGTITGDGSTKEFVITHNLGSQDCIASLRDTATNEVVFADVEFTTENTATVGFADAPAVGQNYKITII